MPNRKPSPPDDTSFRFELKRHLAENGITTNALTVLCPKSYTLWDSEDRTGVSSTS